MIPLGQGTTIFALDANVAVTAQRMNWQRIALMSACGLFHLTWIALLAYRLL